jgi:proteic killer suppression protein
VEIDFKDKKLRELCEQERVAERKLGAVCARKLRSRLADLQAANCVIDLVAGRPHPLDGDRAGQFAVDLEGGRRLVFEPDRNPVPMRDDGGIDWSRVTRVRIVYLGDYHD